jgi:hypothetical protein
MKNPCNVQLYTRTQVGSNTVSNVFHTPPYFPRDLMINASALMLATLQQCCCSFHPTVANSQSSLTGYGLDREVHFFHRHQL